MALALFDLDNTLLNGDSDHSWGLYLAKIGAVDAVKHRAKQDYFYEQYKDGSLDIFEFSKFQFKVYKDNSLAQLQAWHSDFIQEVIEPMIVSGKPELVEQHREAGDTLVIVTATNEFITRPIADRFGVDTLIATQVDFRNGEIKGVPCFQEGKVTRLNQWLAQTGHSLENSYFYSDSINDLPLLEQVSTPIAVTPDDKLRAHAEGLHWQIID